MNLADVIAQEAILAILAFEKSSGRCVFMNRLACEWLELESIESGLAEFRIADLQYSGDLQQIRAVRPLSNEMLASEGLFQDVLIVKRNAQRLIANVGVRQLVNQGLVLVMFQDITIQKKLQREIQAKQDEIHKAYSELIEQNRRLKELDEAKDKFIALTTHELRTPLSAMIATADLVRRKLYSDEKQHDQLVETLVEQGEHLMTLVNDILDFAKIRAGKMDFFVESLSLETMCRRVLQEFDSAATKSQIRISCEIDAKLNVYVDALRFREVLSNLLSNAIKYNRVGGSVSLTAEARDGLVLLHVRDTGVGIAPDKIHHVFNEFETVGQMSGHQKGTGLGMPISRRYMQAMGGNLTVTSIEEEGSVFTAEIPTERVLDEKMYASRGDWKTNFEF